MTEQPTQEPDMMETLRQNLREAGIPEERIEEVAREQMAALDVAPAADAKEGEPDELDKRILKEFPHASEATRKDIRARAIKRHEKHMKREQKRESIDDRIKACVNIEHIGLMRTAIITGIHRGTLKASDRTLDRWQDSLWGRVMQLMLSTTKAGDCQYIYNYTLLWPKPKGLAKLLDDMCAKHVAYLPNDLEQMLRNGVEVEGYSQLPNIILKPTRREITFPTLQQTAK